MARAVAWTLVLSCVVSATSGVQRQAKVRSALHLQCREGQLISVDAATLVSGAHAASHDALNVSRLIAAAGSSAGGGSVPAATAERCQRIYGEQDDDFRTLVRRCSGLSSCIGIVSPNNLTMVPCGEQFGHNADDFLEVSYVCIDASEVSDICDNVSRNLFRGYIRSPSYPAATAARGGRLRCSCVLSAQNYASIELLLLDVDVDSPAAKLEVAPGGGRPISRLCSSEHLTDPASPGAAAAVLAAGCINRRHSTSYSRLNLTFTLNPDPTEATDQPQDRNRFLLRYSARELGRVLSSCQLLEGSGTVVVLPQGQEDDGSLLPRRPGEGATITSVDSEDSVPVEAEEPLPGREDDSGELIIIVSAVVPALLLLAVLIFIGARVAWIRQRKKHWQARNRIILPCCCVGHTSRSSFSPFASRAFDGVLYAMPTPAKCNTLHAYDEAAESSYPADCGDDHYDSIPAHHQYQELEYGCRHYEIVHDIDASSNQHACACDSRAGSDESAWSGEAAAVPLVAPSSSSSSSSTHSGACPAVLACSQSTLYEALGDGELPVTAATAMEPRHGGGSCSSSVRSLGIDFSDIVAESLKHMSVPLFHSAAPAADTGAGRDSSTSSSPSHVQCEDYLTPACMHGGTCCSAAVRVVAAAVTAAAVFDGKEQNAAEPQA